MESPLELIQIQYELSMSIGSSLDMRTMLKTVASVFLRKLSCTAISVYLYDEAEGQNRLTGEPVYAVPRMIGRTESFQRVMQSIPADQDRRTWIQFLDSLPYVHQDAGQYFHILNLPGAGLLVLMRPEQPLSSIVLQSMRPLLVKLASACLACRQNEELARSHQATVAAYEALEQKSQELEESRKTLLRTMEDISRTRQAYQDLATRNQAVLDAIPDWMFTLDRDGRILEYKLPDNIDQTHPLYTRLQNSRTLADLLPDEFSQRALTAISLALESGHIQAFEDKLLIPEGTLHLEARVVASGADRVLAIVRDITARHKAEEQIRELARFPSENPDPVLRIDHAGGILFANQQSRRLLDAWQTPEQGYLPEHWQLLIEEVLASGAGVTVEDQVGDRIYLFTVAPVAEGGYVNLYAQDITDRQKAEQALANERNLLRTLLDTLPDQIYVKDSNSRFLTTNAAQLRVLGAESDRDVIGKTDYDFHPADSAAAYMADEQEILRSGVPLINKEEEVFDAQGRHFWALTSKAPLRDHSGKLIGLVGVTRDISDIREAQRALQEAATRNTLLAQAVEAATDGIVITDPSLPDNPILYTNPSFTQITGYPASEIIGQNCSYFYGEQTDPDAITQIDQAFERQEPATITMLCYRKDGTPFWMEARISPVFADDGTLLYFVISQTDISERLEASELFSAVLNTVGEGIITIDHNGLIVTVNQEVGRIFGYSQSDLIGQSLQMLMPEGYREAHSAGLTRYLATSEPHVLGQRIELEGLRANGEVFPVEVFISETQLADRHLFTASLRDITRRKELDKMRDDFVSTVTHELRTPLASVMGWTETLLTERPGPLTETQKRFLNISYTSSERLNKLIEEILTVSRIQRGTLRLAHSQFDPAACLQTVQEMLLALAEAKEIGLDLDDDWPAGKLINGDEDRMEQVLTNLINNAIKFSPEGATVHVGSRLIDDNWQLTVEDHGIGIPAQDLPSIFDRFYRAQNAAQAQIQGTGLGLYVCKAIVEGHGGEIGIDSVVGQGTTVWFTLPVTETG